MYENYNRWNPYSSELYHWGIPGMHWGQRRYQNADGSLTEEGKIRYGKYSELNNSQRKEADRISKAKTEAGNSAANIARSGADIARMYKNKSTKDSPSKTMSDAELRERINRMNLERQYDMLTGADTRRGAEVAEKILLTTGSLVTIGVGALNRAEKIRCMS